MREEVSRPLTFGKRQRLVHAKEFQAVFAAKKSAAGAILILYGLPNGGAVSRLGLSVGGKFGGAVERNRFKRLCREAFRLEQREAPTGWDFIVVPKRPPATADKAAKHPVWTLELTAVRAEFLNLARKLAGRKRP